MGYYDYKLRRRTADLKPYICGAVIVLLMLLVHCCAGQEQEAAAKSEAEFSIIDEARMVEVMSWQRTTAVEKAYQNWKEGNE